MKKRVFRTIIGCFWAMTILCNSIPVAISEPLLGKRVDNPIQVSAVFVNVYGNEPASLNQFSYSDQFFQRSADDDNPALALASSYLASSTYQEDSIRLSLAIEMGFTECEASYPTASEGIPHTIGYYICKKNIVLDGEIYYLYVVCVRGTPGNYEWLSNFAIGENKPTHNGFMLAAEQVLNAIEKNVITPSDHNIIWLTGHSRGAAVANLVAGKLSRSEQYAPRTRIYAYTFATPNVTRDPLAYSNIRNYVNLADFVTRIPLHTAWGFSRHGIDIILPNSGDVESDMKTYFQTQAGHNYLGLAKWQTDAVISQMEVYAPTVKDYYHSRKEILGIQTPYKFFDGLAYLLMGNPSTGLKLMADELLHSSYAQDILLTLAGLDVIGFGVSIYLNDTHLAAWKMAPVQHAHSKEAYIGYMEALFGVDAFNQMLEIKRYISAGLLKEPHESNTIVSLPQNEPQSTIPNIAVYTIPLAQADVNYPVALQGRVESGTQVRVTRVGMLAGSATNALSEIGYDEQLPERSSIDFYYQLNDDLEPSATYYYQAYADMDGVRYYGDVEQFETDTFLVQASEPENVQPAWNEMRMLGGNIASYKVGDLWGVVLMDGTIVCEPKYNSIIWHPFTEELKVVAMGDSGCFILSMDSGLEMEQTGFGFEGGGVYWDVSSNQLVSQDSVNFTYTTVENTYGFGMFYCVDSSDPQKVLNKMVLVDTNSLTVNNEMYDEVYLPYDNSYVSKYMGDSYQCALGIRDQRCYLIDRAGNESQIGENAGSFFAGVAPFEKDGKWGYIDSNGVVILEPQYDAATSIATYNSVIYAWVLDSQSWKVITF